MWTCVPHIDSLYGANRIYSRGSRVSGRVAQIRTYMVWISVRTASSLLHDARQRERRAGEHRILPLLPFFFRIAFHLGILPQRPLTKYGCAHPYFVTPLRYRAFKI